MITYLLSDESYLSTYAYTDKTVGKLSINLVTRYTDPLNHYNSIVDLNHFFTNKYLCILDKY